MDEFELIARYFTPLGAGGPAGEVGIGDDGAVLDLPVGERLVVVVDTLVEGVHFPPALAPADLGYRAVAVNLSDIAAMGAVPRYATLALTLPAAGADWLAAFSGGLRDALATAGTRLVGGDTTRGPLTITVQILGGLCGPALRRAGAVAGDLVCVSGTVGDAAAGLALVGTRPADPHAAWLLARFTRPTPRLALGQALRPLAHAAIDVSDGLVADLGHIMAASGCGAEIELDALPLSAALLEHCGPEQAQQHALAGGDDYELACAVPPAALAAVQAAAAACGVALHVIGRVVDGRGVVCRDAGGRVVALPRRGYRHFT